MVDDLNLCDVLTCDGGFVQAFVDLAWTGNDDATVRIIHDRAAGNYRQERFETASVTGRVVFDSIPGWTTGIEFTPADINGGVIGHANEISLP